MSSLIFSLFSKLGLFLVSAGIGVVAYFLFAGTSSRAGYEASENVIAIPAVESRLQIPMEAALLAKTQSPVDLSGDAYGVHYVLQQDGKVLRIGNEGTHMKVSTEYADLADGQTDRELGFSAIAFHPEFLVPPPLSPSFFYSSTFLYTLFHYLTSFQNSDSVRKRIRMSSTNTKRSFLVPPTSREAAVK